MAEITLQCTFHHPQISFPATIRLKQSSSTFIVALVTPSNIIANLPPLEGTAFLESLPNSSKLLLQKTEVWMNGFTLATTASGVRMTYEVMIPNFIMELDPTPSPSDIVSLECYFVNIPFTHQQNSVINMTIAGNAIVMTAKKRGKISHVVTISGVYYRNKETIIAEMESLGWLVSLATGRMCHIAKIVARRGNRIVYNEQRSLGPSIGLNHGTPLVLPQNLSSADIARFLEHAFVLFQQQNSTYRLNNLIGLGILAKDTNYQENMLLLMSNFLEVVRYNYALNVGVPNGIFRVGNNDTFSWDSNHKPPWANPHNPKSNAASFRDILFHFCLQSGITKWDDDFKDIRNEIIHSGKVLKSATSRYLKLHHFCDTVLLALFDWDRVQGTYVPINDPNRSNPTQGTTRLPFFTR